MACFDLPFELFYSFYIVSESEGRSSISFQSCNEGRSGILAVTMQETKGFFIMI